MKHSTRIRCIVLAGLALASSASLRAQGLYTLEIPRQEVTTVPSGFVEFSIKIINTGFVPTTITIVRAVNQLPASSWYTSMCTGENCYRPDQDTATVTLKTGESIVAKLSVVSGQVPNQSAHVELQFSAGMGDEPVTKAFDVTIASPSSVEPETLADGQILPNPTVSNAHYSYQLPSAGDSRIEIFSLIGRKVLTVDNGYQIAGPHTTELDLSSLASGAYLLRLTGDSLIDTKRITVTR